MMSRSQGMENKGSKSLNVCTYELILIFNYTWLLDFVGVKIELGCIKNNSTYNKLISGIE